MSSTQVQVKLLHPLAQVYEQFHAGDSGLDLVCPEDIVVPAGGTARIDFGLAVSAKRSDIPLSFWLLPRSSIVKTPLRMANSVGLIDAGYRGPLCAYVDNRSSDPYLIEAGTRLFQIAMADLAPFAVTLVDQLDETTRGTGGFGST